MEPGSQTLGERGQRAVVVEPRCIFKTSTQDARTQSLCSTQVYDGIIRPVKSGRSERERETWFQDA